MADDGQYTMMAIGIAIGQDNPKLDMGTLKDLEEFRIFLNNEYNINVVRGMSWFYVFKEVETGIANKHFNAAMGVV